MTQRKLTRRHVLRAAGGLAVTLPILRSLSARGAEEEFPKRLVLMYTPNGVIQDAWWPTVTSETEFSLGPTHAALADYQDRLLYLHGIENRVAKEGLTGGPHQRGIGALYTGRQLQNGEFVDGCGKKAGWADGISLDQEVAASIGMNTPLASLELGVRATENDVQGRIAYAGAGNPLPPFNQPLDVYNRLFTDGNAPEVTPGDPLVAQQKSVLDAVEAQFASLKTRVGAEDAVKLDAHLTLVRDIERRMTATGTGNCATPEAPATLDPNSETDMPTIAELEIDLMSLAFACDLTRVATFQISTSLNRIRYPWLDSLGEGHALSHSSGIAAQRAELMTRDAWHAGLVARLCSNLAAVPEGDGSALDNTLIVWCTEVTDGSIHSHVNMPFLLLGGGWHFRTGRYLELDGTPHNDLLVSLLNAMGKDSQTFGDPAFVNGPIDTLV